MASHTLKLPPRARRPAYRWISLPRILTGIAWIVVGVSLGVLCMVTSQGDVLARLLWPTVSVAAVLSAVGLLFGWRWARFVIAPVAVVAGLFVAFISVSAPYLFHWWWWGGPIFVSFCVWTFVLVTRLWADSFAP